MGDIGIPELLLILGIALLIFGPRKIGELGKGLGEGIRHFKAGLREPSEEPATPPAAAATAATTPAAAPTVEEKH